MDRGVGPRFDAAVVAVDGFVPRDLCILEVLGLLLGGEHFDIVAQGALIALERQHIIGLFFEDFPGDLALAADRVNGDDGASSANKSSSLGMATISLDLSATLTWPSTKR